MNWTNLLQAYIGGILTLTGYLLGRELYSKELKDRCKKILNQRMSKLKSKEVRFWIEFDKDNREMIEEIDFDEKREIKNIESDEFLELIDTLEKEEYEDHLSDIDESYRKYDQLRFKYGKRAELMKKILITAIFGSILITIYPWINKNYHVLHELFMVFTIVIHLAFLFYLGQYINIAIDSYRRSD